MTQVQISSQSQFRLNLPNYRTNIIEFGQIRNTCEFFIYFCRNDEYHQRANWSPESSVKGGFDDRDIQDIHDIHDMPELQGKMNLNKI